MDPVIPTAPVEPCKPVAPVAPVRPFMPCGPVAPLAPTGPTRPVTPTAPLGPIAPVAPCGPVAPRAPVAPTPIISAGICATGTLPLLSREATPLATPRSPHVSAFKISSKRPIVVFFVVGVAACWSTIASKSSRSGESFSGRSDIRFLAMGYSRGNSFLPYKIAHFTGSIYRRNARQIAIQDTAQ